MGTYLNRTPSSAGNEKTWTVSLWVKRASITSTSSQFLFASDTGYSQYVWCRFCGTEVTGKADMLQVFMVEPNARESNVRTNRLFRDPSSWYHIVIRCDTTQSTAADRLRIYVNGVEETSFDTASYLNQNDDNMNWNSNVPQIIGAQLSGGTSERFQNGYITNFVNIDGQSLAPTSFGETDSTTGEWKPKADLSGLTFGTNGFWLKYESAGNLGIDSSGNSNTYTVNNAGTNAKTVDTASNNFVTWNPLVNRSFQYPMTLSEGNLKVIADSNTSYGSTMAATVSLGKGKWFWEFKYTTSGTGGYVVGWGEDTYNFNYQADAYPYKTTLGSSSGVFYRADGGKAVNGTETGSAGDAWAQNDIIGVAADLNAKTISFYNQGVLQFTVTSAFTAGVSYYPEFYGYGSKGGQANFGNPPFTISSGNADANGHGNFEYAVPSGYYALCTKNINSYG